MKVVENAIIVPIFTMIIIALISVGIYMHDRIIIRNMVSQISIEYEKESDITARKELIKRGERYAADRTMFLRDINIYDDRVYQQDESERLLRLPLYYGMKKIDVERVIDAIMEFYTK